MDQVMEVFITLLMGICILPFGILLLALLWQSFCWIIRTAAGVEELDYRTQGLSAEVGVLLQERRAKAKGKKRGNS
jgi:hypothetical protein